MTLGGAVGIVRRVTRKAGVLFVLLALLGAGAFAVAEAAVPGRGLSSTPPATLTKLCGLPYVSGKVEHFRTGDGASLVGAVAGPGGGGSVGVLLANKTDGGICDWVSSFGQEKLINVLAAEC